MPLTSPLVRQVRLALRALDGQSPARLMVLEEAIIGLPRPRALPERPRGLELITFDLDDPTLGWGAGRAGLRWRPAAVLADAHPPLAALCEPLRVKLTLAQSLTSPRLAPAFAALLALPLEPERRPKKLILHAADGQRLISARGFTNGLREGLAMKLTAAGLERLPALAERAPLLDEAGAARLEVRPAELPALLGLKASARLSPEALVDQSAHA